MPEIIIYSTNVCSYCIRAKKLLLQHGITNITEIKIDDNPEFKTEMIEKSGGRKTVPQIFINGTHIGGFDDLAILHSNGQLKILLQS